MLISCGYHKQVGPRAHEVRPIPRVYLQIYKNTVYLFTCRLRTTPTKEKEPRHTAFWSDQKAPLAKMFWHAGDTKVVQK
jgi:hypothetical protein